MSTSEFLIKNISHPLWLAKDCNLGQIKQIKLAEKFGLLDAEQIESLQLSSLRKILLHASHNTNYYKNVINAEILNNTKDSNIKSLISDFPLLTKKIIRDQYQQLVAQNIPPKRRQPASTGGSTGTPMHFLRDKECVQARKGQEAFFDNWMNYTVGKKTALFVAASHHETTTSKFKAWLRNSTSDRLLRFDPGNITPNYLEEFEYDFFRYQPRVIKCFPNSLVVFADYLAKKNRTYDGLISISCTGETLYDWQKRLFMQVFNTEIFEKYGTKECGVISSECHNHDGQHIFSPGVFVEILDDNNQPAVAGSIGKIVLTDLYNYAFPLIRYDIGDRAIQSNFVSCKCGSSLPKFQKLLGRDRDIIYDTNMNPKPGYLFVEVINKMSLPGQYQIAQKTVGELIIRHTKETTPDAIKIIKHEYLKIVGSDTSIKSELHSTISRDPSGKYRYVTSELKHNA